MARGRQRLTSVGLTKNQLDATHDAIVGALEEKDFCEGLYATNYMAAAERIATAKNANPEEKTEFFFARMGWFDLKAAHDAVSAAIEAEDYDPEVPVEDYVSALVKLSLAVGRHHEKNQHVFNGHRSDGHGKIHDND